MRNLPLHSHRYTHSLHFFFLLRPPPPRSTLFPYTTLFRSRDHRPARDDGNGAACGTYSRRQERAVERSEEHTSELQSRFDLVCRLLLEKKKKTIKKYSSFSIPYLRHTPQNCPNMPSIHLITLTSQTRPTPSPLFQRPAPPLTSTRTTSS